MKIPASIRLLYEDQRAKNIRLKGKVDLLAIGFKSGSWHYESRVKEQISFTLKLETGRVEDVKALEDFFACTFVVPTFSDIKVAEALVLEKFNFQYRRPPDPKVTNNNSDQFSFDGLRLYVRLKRDVSAPEDPELEGTTFEIQIKTFLQHAWTIATHDLVYKTDGVSWSRERIAYQAKAMLEHAEISISKAELLSLSDFLDMENGETKLLRETIDLIKDQWDPAQLPKDLRRLAQNVIAVIKAVSIKPDRLREILELAKGKNGGSHPSNLSPYASIIQYLFEYERHDLVSILKAKKKPYGKRPTRILISQEISIPEALDKAEMINAIFVMG